MRWLEPKWAWAKEPGHSGQEVSWQDSWSQNRYKPEVPRVLHDGWRQSKHRRRSNLEEWLELRCAQAGRSGGPLCMGTLEGQLELKLVQAWSDLGCLAPCHQEDSLSCSGHCMGIPHYVGILGVTLGAFFGGGSCGWWRLRVWGSRRKELDTICAINLKGNINNGTHLTTCPTPESVLKLLIIWQSSRASSFIL